MDITEAIKIKGARLQIQINEDTKQGRYQSALYFGEEQLKDLTEDDIYKQCKDLAEGWAKHVELESSKPPYEPTKEELIAMKTEAEQRIIETTAQVAELEAKIKAKDVKPIEVKPIEEDKP
jgi:hypothetical protein